MSNWIIGIGSVMKEIRKVKVVNDVHDYQEHEEEIVAKIKQTKTITQFMICIFQLIEERGFDSTGDKYFHDIKAYGRIGELNELVRIVEALEHCGENECEFSDWLDLWIRFLEKVSWEPEVVFWATLLEYDSYCSENYRNTRGLGKNEIITIAKIEQAFNGQGYILTPCIKHTIFSKKMKESKVLAGRQTEDMDRDVLNDNLWNFKILKQADLGNYNITIQKYNSASAFLSDEVAIGISSLSIEKWFKIELNHTSRKFSIKNNDDLKDFQNKGIWEAVLEYDNMGADILIFPEITMNRETEGYLKKQLVNYRLKNLKLIFAGSFWNKDERTNGSTR